MDFKFWNKTLAWGVFVIALVSYYLTLEQYVPLWDCGEYISTAYKLEVGHPPGAPTFNMIGAVSAYFVPKESVAMTINFISALCSAFTIFFMFLTISYMAKKLALINGGEFSDDKKIAVLGSAAIGALAYTFTDSFWFSAVEGEVYAMSSFFTALVVWAIYKWDDVADEPYADRWLIFIMYMIGLSIGVHLLNLLAIPAIGMLYYFRRYRATTKGGIIAFVVTVLILGAIQTIIIPGMAKWPAKTELLFVNDFGLPFSFGATFFFLLLISAIIYGIRRSIRLQKHMLYIASMSLAVILIGFSSYAVIMIRSQANPPVDENNPENYPQLLSYFNRDQYGSAPLLVGNYWNSETDPTKAEDGDPVYMRGFMIKRGDVEVRGFRTEKEASDYAKANEMGNVEIVEKYFIGDDRKEIEPYYIPEHTTVFPRMYSREERHIRMYRKWSDYKGGEYLTKDIQRQYEGISAEIEQIETASSQGMANQEMMMRLNELKNYKERRFDIPGIKLPTFGENLRFFFNYQMGWMYWRYFLWNFVGRQSDEQNIDGNILDGNWYSGVGFIDSERLGDQSNIPPVISENKAHNKFFYLPLIIGLIGMIYHLLKAPKDWLIILLLFLFTGMAIIVYLNSKPAEPRERDYAYAGSYYAFAFWIGIGVYALFDMVKNVNWKQYQKAALIALGFGAFLYLIELLTEGQHAFSYSILYMSVVAFGMIALMIAAGSKLKDMRHAAALAIVLGASVPTILATQGWDDHDRSKRSTARSFAMNFMRSCGPNAIMFTYGDNDTFPLWYIQEVEEYRTDSRIVNTSLLGTDWYIDQMTRKAYDSDPVPFTVPEYIYRQGGKIDQFELQDDGSGVALDLKAELLKQRDNPRDNKDYGVNWVILDSKTFYIKVNKANAIKSGIVPKGMEDQVLDRIEFRVPDNILQKNDFMILDLLANYDWTRPIYFATGNSSREYLGLQSYFLQEGLAYKLVPYKTEGSPYSIAGMNIEKTYNMLMGTSENPDENYEWGGMDAPGANVDFYVRRTICSSYQMVFISLAGALLSETESLDQRITQSEFNLRIIQDSMETNPDDATLKKNFEQTSAALNNLRARKGKYDYKAMAKKVIRKCFEVMPVENVPYDNFYSKFFVQLAFEAGDKEFGIELMKGIAKQSKEMLTYICKMEARHSNTLVSTVSDSYQTIMEVYSYVDEAMNSPELEQYIITEENEVNNLMREFVDKIQKYDAKLMQNLMMAIPRFFTNSTEQRIAEILSMDKKEGIKLIAELGGHFESIQYAADNIIRSGADDNVKRNMQQLAQSTERAVGQWVQDVMTAFPEKQGDLAKAFPNFFKRRGNPQPSVEELLNQ